MVAQQRLEGRGEAGGRGAFVFARLRQHVGRQHNPQGRVFRFEPRLQPPLGFGVAGAVQQADGDRLQVTGATPRRDLGHCRAGHRTAHPSVRVEPFVHFVHVFQRHERGGGPPRSERSLAAVVVRPVQFQDVAKAGRDQQTDARQRVLQDRVGGGRRAVRQPVGPHAAALQRRQCRPEAVARRRSRRQLGVQDRAAVRMGDHVGERTADVDPRPGLHTTAAPFPAGLFREARHDLAGEQVE